MWKWQAINHNSSHKIVVKNSSIKYVIQQLLEVEGVIVESYIEIPPLKEELQLSVATSPKKNRPLDKFSKLSFLCVSWLKEKLTS